MSFGSQFAKYGSILALGILAAVALRFVFDRALIAQLPFLY